VDTLSGSIERITYYNPENGYSVLQLRPERSRGLPYLSRDGLATVVGNLPEINPGEYLRLKGFWVNHPKHGGQFKTEICEQTLPATVAGIKRYLGSGLIKGVGPKLAGRIVDYFGAETLEIIDEQPQRLREVPDIGPKRSRKIVKAWDEQRQVKEIMLFLHSHHISTNLAVKIYKTYGDAALSTVQENPYQLARDIYGVGFKTADKIAQDLGLPHDHPSRVEAGIIYALNQMSDDGHVYVPQDELTRQAAQLLEVSVDFVPAALSRLAQDERIRADILPLRDSSSALKKETFSDKGIAESQNDDYGKPAIYLTPFYYSEKGVAERLGVLKNSSNHQDKQFPLMLPDTSLSSEQQKAIHTALTHPVSVLTGGPGTGKTTCLKALIFYLESQSTRYALASPTGRAAKRLSEATDRPASTIHRLLGYSPMEGFKYHTNNPLPIDFLVVDETSMLDLILANHLLRALKPDTHLLLVGDVDQLPSVGAGDVLRDVIASGRVPVTRLTQIFRQAAGSLIITNAHKINNGEMPVFSPAHQASPKTTEKGEIKPGGDFYLFPAKDATTAADWVVDVVTARIPDKFGFDPLREIQVLAPMYRGPVGVSSLNERLQENLNAARTQTPQKRLFGTTFRPGDKVMQIQNNYDKDVFNGDIGFITGIDLVEHLLTVEFDGRQIGYDFSETDQLVLAYAVTVHKAQGSEFPVVVIPLVTAHYMMLQRNLLYTAITRARNLCVLVGGQKAIAMAVHNNKVAQRYSALDWRMRTMAIS